MVEVIARAGPAILPALMLAGCVASPIDSEAEKLKAGLVRVETQCGAKPGTLKIDGENLVAVVPEPDAKYETLDCVFRELKMPEFADHIKLGFVVNEMHPREDQK